MKQAIRATILFQSNFPVFALLVDTLTMMMGAAYYTEKAYYYLTH